MPRGVGRLIRSRVMEAQTLHCSSCGAAVSSDSPVCQHCGARLATISCPTCFQMMFRGAKFCPHCGAAAVVWESGSKDFLCPGCERPLLRGKLDRFTLHECEKCFGLWVDKDTVEHVCRDAEQQALAPSVAAPPANPLNAPVPKIRYVRCPQCRELMHRVNFAQTSGVVVDVCREHGTWFDANELQRIVQFIRAGGLERSREKQKTELAAERRRLQASRLAAHDGVASSAESYPGLGQALLPEILLSVGNLLGWRKR